MKKCLQLTYVILLTLSTSLSGQEMHQELIPENVPLMGGSFISGSELMNKIIIVNIWATWCKYCIKELPDLNRIIMKHQNNENVVFLAITPSEIDNSESVNRFLEKNEFLIQQVTPGITPTFIKEIEKISYPTTMVYSQHGELEEKFVGPLKKGELKKIDWIINKFMADRDP